MAISEEKNNPGDIPTLAHFSSQKYFSGKFLALGNYPDSIL
jgi:hypothetical protein